MSFVHQIPACDSYAVTMQVAPLVSASIIKLKEMKQSHLMEIHSFDPIIMYPHSTICDTLFYDVVMMHVVSTNPQIMLSNHTHS